MATSGVILLAEDDRRLRKLYTDAFEASGYSILSVSDGDEALEMLHRMKPTVILLDIMMPRLSGIETCKRARKMVGSEVPIIFLTALDELGTLQKCIAAGGDDYLIKSESVATVIERVGQWVQRPQGRNQLAKRREEMLADVTVKVVKRERCRPLSSETDETVREISEFLREARANAAEGFGQTVKEKLYLLGYTTGVVEHWAQLRNVLEERFLDYLRAVLNETGILENDEVSEMLSGFDDLSVDTCFGIARAHGRNDPVQRQSKGKDFAPIGLGQFQLLAGV
jgi:DNA-binding response OmpR family regulator